MTDIFISYKREDRAVAERLALKFTQRGYAVWWDASLLAGDAFVDEINKRLDQARLAVVLWSEGALESRWVKAEAYRAWEDEKYLGALIAPDIRVPAPYGASQHEDLTAFAAGEGSLDPLLASVQARIGRGAQAQRAVEEAAASLKASEAEAAIWFKIHDSDEPEAFEFYLKQYGETATFAEEARAKIRETTSVVSHGGRWGRWLVGGAVAAASISVAAIEGYKLTLPYGPVPVVTIDDRPLSEARAEIETLRGAGVFASAELKLKDEEIEELSQRITHLSSIVEKSKKSEDDVLGNVDLYNKIDIDEWSSIPVKELGAIIRIVCGAGNSELCKSLMTPLAKLGYPEAQFWLGRIYSAGDGVPRNVTLAYVLWRAAASAGHQQAETALANLSTQLTTTDLAMAEQVFRMGQLDAE